jgi:hypothetical protein
VHDLARDLCPVVEFFDDEEATPCKWMAAAVVAVAVAMVCLPGLISIIWRGDLAPAATGLGLLGFSLFCVKFVSFLYGVRGFTAPDGEGDPSFESEAPQLAEGMRARIRIAAG